MWAKLLDKPKTQGARVQASREAPEEEVRQELEQTYQDVKQEERGCPAADIL